MAPKTLSQTLRDKANAAALKEAQDLSCLASVDTQSPVPVTVANATKTSSGAVTAKAALISVAPIMTDAVVFHVEGDSDLARNFRQKLLTICYATACNKDVDREQALNALVTAVHNLGGISMDDDFKIMFAESSIALVFQTISEEDIQLYDKYEKAMSEADASKREKSLEEVTSSKKPSEEQAIEKFKSLYDTHLAPAGFEPKSALHGNWLAQFALMCISDAKASKAEDNYKTYIVRRLRAFLGGSDPKEYTEEEQGKFLVPSYTFSKVMKGHHRLGSALRRTILGVVRTMQMSSAETVATVGGLMATYLSFTGMSALLVVIKFLLAPGSPVLDHPSVASEVSRLAKAVQLLNIQSYVRAVASSTTTEVAGAASSSSLFPFASYLRLKPAALISWQSLRVLGSVAVSLASLSGSTFGQLTNTVEGRGGSAEIQTQVKMLTNLARGDEIETPGPVIQEAEELEEAAKKAREQGTD